MVVFRCKPAVLAAAFGASLATLAAHAAPPQPASQTPPQTTAPSHNWQPPPPRAAQGTQQIRVPHRGMNGMHGHRWQQMSPAQRAAVRERAREFRAMNPEQRQRVREAYHYFHSLSPEQREQLRSQWRGMSLQERQQWLERQQHPPTPQGAQSGGPR
jgi:hypothetical protein